VTLPACRMAGPRSAVPDGAPRAVPKSAGRALADLRRPRADSHLMAEVERLRVEACRFASRPERPMRRCPQGDSRGLVTVQWLVGNAAVASLVGERQDAEGGPTGVRSVLERAIRQARDWSSSCNASPEMRA
jgi:hypothetical protein